MKFSVVCVVAIAAIALVVPSAVQAAVFSKTDLSVNCDSIKCFQMCIMNGYMGGTCEFNNCVCRGKLPVQNLQVLSEMQKSTADDKLSGDCQDTQCFLMCRQGGYASGYCRFGDCACQRRQLLSQNSIIKAMPVNKKAAGCDPAHCMNFCMSVGKTMGVCVKDTCLCF